MNCPNCKTYNPSNANYCSECGAPMSAPGGETRDSQEPGLEQRESPYGLGRPAAWPPSEGELIPRNLSGLVAETFVVYRANFGLLSRIVLIAYIPLVVSVFIPSDALAASLSLAGLFTGLLAGGAVVYALSQHYLGRRTTVGMCYTVALNSALALLGAFLVFMAAVVAGVILSFFVIGIPLLAYVAVVWFFYPQAVIVERYGPMAALGRSWALVRGSWWRVFGIGLVFVAVLVVASFIASVPGLIVGIASDILGNLLVTIGGVFIAPIGYVGATLVYFDLRVRKEGYSLEALASEVG